MERAVFVIPCGGKKVDQAAPARDLYIGSAFRLALRAALSQAESEADVFILSALHGLVSLDTVLEPYDVKMGDAKSIDAVSIACQMIEHDIVDADIYAMLPKAYLEKLDTAGRIHDNYVQNVYEVNRGIGEQRGICSCVLRHDDVFSTAA